MIIMIMIIITKQAARGPGRPSASSGAPEAAPEAVEVAACLNNIE